MLDQALLDSIDESILCWLATVDAAGQPNVSPKEVFMAFGEDEMLIADIASPQSVRNIQAHAQVCVSFVHVLKEKGFQCKGEARYLVKDDHGFDERYTPIYAITGEDFPVKGIIAIKIASVKPIIAPSYYLNPDKTEAQRLAHNRRAYGLDPDE